MNPDMQMHLTNITNSNKPTLTEIEDNIFPATERYLAAAKFGKQSYDAVSLVDENITHATAAAVRQTGSSKAYFCSLCSTRDIKESSHSTSNCPKFPDAQSKLDKIK